MKRYGKKIQILSSKIFALFLWLFQDILDPGTWFPVTGLYFSVTRLDFRKPMAPFRETRS